MQELIEKVKAVMGNAAKLIAQYQQTLTEKNAKIDELKQQLASVSSEYATAMAAEEVEDREQAAKDKQAAELQEDLAQILAGFEKEFPAEATVE